MTRISKTELVDDAFRFGVVIKAIDGGFELITGLLVLLIPEHIYHNLIMHLLTHGYSAAQHATIAGWLNSLNTYLTGSGIFYTSLYLLGHGIVKVVLAYFLLKNIYRAYPISILVLIGFIVYQGYEIALHQSSSLIYLTIFDLLIVALSIWEYRRHTGKLAKS